jgi:UDP-glucose 4-epimerase
VKDQKVVQKHELLLTGAAGFIGSHFINKYSSKYNIQTIDNQRSGDWSRIKGLGSPENLDLNLVSDENLLQLLHNKKTLLHLAAEKHNSSLDNPSAIYNLNVTTTERLFRLAAESGVKTIVFSSSLYVYGRRPKKIMEETDPLIPDTNYGISKWCGELILRKLALDYGLTWHAPRFFFIYGPDQYAKGGYKSVITKNLERARKNQSLTICGDGKQSLDYVYIDDLIESLHLIINKTESTGSMNIASSKAIAVRDIIEIISDITGVRRIDFLSADETHDSNRVGSNKKMFEELNFRPTINMREGLENIWRTMNER